MHKFAPHRVGNQLPTTCVNKENITTSESGAIPMLHDKAHRHKATGHMSLEQLEELRAVEYQAAANLVWIADTGASCDVLL